MIKLMFVCHGNICRSPMAEFIMKELVAEKGLADNFLIKSSATSYEEIGNPIYPPALAELKRNNISVGEKYAIKLKRDDYEKYDLFICMDDNNLRNIKHIFKCDPQNKIRKLLASDVEDPWYYGNFDVTYKDIEKGCKALLESLIN
ncbi:MAG: low molecular weight phosphotyrosine protein phosphatase [Clostridia bacterium]|nr:low molecular weight phosphotyrosine protein phosphatase [Clostridia bacterium]